MTKTIAITGATGALGQLAVAALKARAPEADIVALVRDTAKAAELGVEARSFDYHAADTLEAPLNGVDVLVLISSNDFNDRAGQHRNVIAAAKAAGVGRIVYTSILRADTSPMMLAADHKATEEAIAEAGLTATILRNGWYTENYTGSLAGSVAAGAIAGANQGGKVNSATRADYAEAIAVVASDDAHAGKTYEVTGDDAYTMADLAAEVSRVTGKDIAYQPMPEQAYADLLKSFGLPEGAAIVFADSDARAGEGALLDESHTLSKLIGRPTTPWQETVKAALS